MSDEAQEIGNNYSPNHFEDYDEVVMEQDLSAYRKKDLQIQIEGEAVHDYSDGANPLTFSQNFENPKNFNFNEQP